jgi:two-component system response regulator
MSAAEVMPRLLLVDSFIPMRFEDTYFLVAEDDPDDAELLQLAFERSLILTPIVWLRNGEEVIDHLSGKSRGTERASSLPSLVLLDLKMPKRNGIEVYKWMRATFGAAMVPTVLWSSSRELEDLNKARKAGVDWFLTKPDTFDELKEMVQRLHRTLVRANPSIVGDEFGRGRL